MAVQATNPSLILGQRRPWLPALEWGARRSESFVIPVAAILVGLAIFSVFLLLIGRSPIQFYQLMYKGGFGSWFSIQNTLARASPLLLAALCVALPARLGLVVIGGEGAIALGGTAAAAAALPIMGVVPPFLLWFVMGIAGAFVGAFLGQALRRVALHRGFNTFGVTMIAAALASGVYLGFVELLHVLGLTGGVHEAGYASAALFLVPGFPLVTGALDLAKLDFSAGLARLTNALMILVSAAFSVWAVSIVAGLSPDPPQPLALGVVALTLLRAAASFVGVLGFALMFNSPRRMALVAALVATVPNVLRIAAVEHIAWPPQAAAAAAACLVGLLAAWIAPRLNIPRITVYVPAVTIMVPGVPAYRAVFYLSNGDITNAMSYGVSAALVVAALAIGLGIARMLTDREWGLEH